MTVANKILSLLGILMLVHSGFSTFELKQYSKQTVSVFKIPTDIYIELAISLVILTYTIITTVACNSDYGINLYTGKRTKLDGLNFKNIYMNQAIADDEKFDSGTFDHIESNATFIDIRSRRKEFDEWIEKQ